jgi:hypothetical protein
MKWSTDLREPQVTKLLPEGPPANAISPYALPARTRRDVHPGMADM